ncbi:ankyrin repeat domain-containing protein [Helicobacter trogontum]|uniref:Ankyrin repeat domain-containing protein n=1 Tax=Helicobacter trogontum TaxID=50960 RepID=A0A4U8SFJ7_9HELI|nr:ankyrin repeat domain-containing protein [Helicobacter trogontum]TLD84973.1 ankyrin repeat domain-containing protein [Helicobacter trogontum]
MEKQSFEYYLNAMENGNIKELEIFLAIDDQEFVNMQDKDGNTLLHHAARLGSEGGVAMLIDCNPFIRNNDGKTAFNIAYENDNECIARMLEMTKNSWESKYGDSDEDDCEDEDEEMDIPFYLTGSKESILKQLEEQINDESLLDISYGDGSIILQSVLHAWNLSFIDKKMPPVVEILIDKANGDVEMLIEGFDRYMERWESEIWDEPTSYTSTNEDGEEDYRYETDPDEWIREIMPLDEWEELKEQMRAYAAKIG